MVFSPRASIMIRRTWLWEQKKASGGDGDKSRATDVAGGSPADKGEDFKFKFKAEGVGMR